MRLSNSAIDTYQRCPKQYYFHYIRKIRSDAIGSALVFGKAIDEALNVLLLTKKKELTEEEQSIADRDVYDLFKESLSIIDINSTEIDVPRSSQVYYYKSDCDTSALTDEDYEKIIQESDEITTVDDVDHFIGYVQATIKSRGPIQDADLKLYNFICWSCLYRKGILMIDEYKRIIMPRIVEVHSIQTEVMLPNDNGDYIIGYVDFEATLDDGIRYVLDNKTSSQPYADKSVEQSQQLSIYSEFLENRNCGYIVMIKKLRKKHPRVRTQVITDTIPETQIEKVFDLVGEVEYNVKNKNFKENWDSCFQFGRKCPYFDLCRTGSMEQLTKLEDIGE